ncbi:MAG: 2-oxoacid:acceptor oxidoreductase family protein [Candidatus Latescibacteria bacterium]|nr:2-oxoacid:acceptor oxidoreductase family protein [Candidatus Latescibacterota bacterium]
MSQTPLSTTPASAAVPRGLAESHSLVMALVGSGGDGVALLGDLMLRMAAQQGLYGMMVQSYGPQIRGGESAVILRIGRQETVYEGDRTDIFLCFRLADLKRFQGAVRLHPQSVVIQEESDTGDLPEWIGRSDRETYRYPFAKIENGIEVPGDPKNMLALALLCRVLGWPAALAREAIGHRFGSRPDVLGRNLAAFDRALAAAPPPPFPIAPGTGRSLFAETGNEAIARGAITAGLRFFAGYPITPSSEIMETLIDELPLAGGCVVQAEDEIAALGMVLGASFGGVPGMTATSGPGLSLMTEMTGLSSMAELPAVIVDCQRAGPATGMPSRTEQADLYHAVFAGHGDFPRAVLGVFDVVHAREVMYKAFTLSERYQLPVLVLSDAYIAQRRQIRAPVEDSRVPPERLVWKPGMGPARFDVGGEHGVTPFRVPGNPEGTYLAAGIEHTQEGYPTADGTIHQQMNAKRFRKLEAIARDTKDWFRTLGAPHAPRGIIAWGSQYGLMKEWVAGHPEYRVFLPEILHPFPIAALDAWRKNLESAAVVEMSYQGQLHRTLAGLTDLSGVVSVTRSGGTPMKQAELERLLDERRS